jgi:hypothetical protein
MSDYMPGPWRVVRKHPRLPAAIVADDPGYGGSPFELASVSPWSPTAHANAKLIAKAPDMVAALWALRRCPGIDQTDQDTGQTFRALIDTILREVT